MAISRSETEALQALGYLGAEGPARTDPPDPRDLVGAHTHMEKARHLAGRGQIRDALAELDEMLALDPGNVSAMTTKAELLAQQGRLREARAIAERRLAADPEGAASYLLLARLEIMAGKPESALDLARLGAKKRGAFHTLTMIEARALALLGRQSEAVEVLDRGLQEAPNDPDLLTARGVSYIRQGQEGVGESMLRKAVEVDAFHFQARLALSEFLKENGRAKEAISLLEEVLRREPGQPEVLAALGRAHEDFPESAVPILEEAVRLNPSRFDALYNLGLNYLRIGQARKGEASLRRALKLQPAHPGCRNNLSISLIMQGRLEEAEGELEALIQEHPDFAGAYNNLAMVHVRRRNWAEAERLVQKSLELGPGAVDPTLTYARILNELGRYDETVELIERLGAEHHRRPDVAAPYGMALAALGRCELAIPQLDNAMQSFVDEADVVIALARCEERAGDRNRAAELYERAAQIAAPGPVREEALASVERMALATGRE